MFAVSFAIDSFFLWAVCSSAPVNLQTREWWVKKFRENGLLDVTSPKRKRFLVHGQQFDSKAYIAGMMYADHQSIGGLNILGL